MVAEGNWSLESDSVPVDAAPETFRALVSGNIQMITHASG